jgi:hypothetical protein
MVLGPFFFTRNTTGNEIRNVPGTNRPVRNTYDVGSSYSRLRTLVCSRQFDRAVEIVQRSDGFCD